MLEFAEPRIIRPATENDIEPLKKTFSHGDGTVHIERYEKQKSGDAVYLLAVQGIVPVGYAFVKFTGTTNEAVAPHLSEPTADIHALHVLEEHRNRMVGSRLLVMAETLAAERGIRQIGIASAADNTTARKLYDERGYLDSGIEAFTVFGKVDNAEGEPEEWKKESCAYLLKPLTPVAAPENTMENETNTTEENTDTDGYVATETLQPTGRPVGEQVVDFAFGVALTAAEALESAVKTAQAEAPGIWTALQEKGRPAREKLVQSLREEAREEAEAAAKKAEEIADEIDLPGDEDDTDNAGDGSAPLVKTVAPKEPAPIKPAPRPFGWGRTGNVSAEDEIRALEDRVRTLEQEVVVAPPVLGDAPGQTEDAVNIAAPTPAETGTALVDFSPESNDGSALTDSAYSITDDEERATAPSQTGTFVSDTTSGTAIDTEGASSPEAVSAYVDGAEAPATDANIGDSETQLAPAKGKRGKKTTSEASAGTDETPEVGEEPEA